jgi:carbonic anhydrase
MSKISEALSSVTYDYLNKELQKEINPDDALAALKSGNARFVEGKPVERNYNIQIQGTSTGQYPHSVVLSCIDSRVPTEIVFDQGIGDIFNARVAGNISNVDVIGSIEYACKVAGSKLIVVLGHTSCGAVKGAIADVKLGNVTELIAKIKPAIRSVKDGYQGITDDSNSDFVGKVVKENVHKTIANILRESHVLTDMLEAGEIDIVGAIYDVASGKVDFL